MKHHRATGADPGVAASDELDEAPGRFDNPFHIRGEEPPAGPIPPAEPTATIDLTAATPSVASTGAPHVAPPPSSPVALDEAEPAGSGIVVAPAVTEDDQRDALDLTRVESHARAGRSAATAAPGFLPASPPRLRVESALVRLIATAGVVAIGTAVGAALVAKDVEGWIVGLAVSLVCVALAAVLWRSRRL